MSMAEPALGIQNQGAINGGWVTPQLDIKPSTPALQTPMNIWYNNTL